jgi:hypothetical protein
MAAETDTDTDPSALISEKVAGGILPKVLTTFDMVAIFVAIVLFITNAAVIQSAGPAAFGWWIIGFVVSGISPTPTRTSTSTSAWPSTMWAPTPPRSWRNRSSWRRSARSWSPPTPGARPSFTTSARCCGGGHRPGAWRVGGIG